MGRAASLLLALLALAGCGGADDEAADPAESGAAPQQATAVKELANVLQLRSDYEADTGKPRVIVLLSPT